MHEEFTNLQNTDELKNSFCNLRVIPEIFIIIELLKEIWVTIYISAQEDDSDFHYNPGI